MKCGFLGNGGMGQAMQRLAEERGHTLVSVVDQHDEWKFDTADVVFEATAPQSCFQNIQKLCELKNNIIVVTTGWYDQLESVRNLVQVSGNRVLWSSNFSIGVHLYFRMLREAARLINTIDEYDVWATEIHHRHKVDSPSGTAKTMETILLEEIDRKTAIVEDRLNRKIEPHEIHFSSTRGGDVNFGHVVGFDSAADVITLQHTARNRNGYALGAIRAGEWLVQQSPGLYTMDDFLSSSFKT